MAECEKSDEPFTEIHGVEVECDWGKGVGARDTGCDGLEDVEVGGYAGEDI